MLWAGVNKDEIFTTNPRETPVHIVVWGFLGEAFPFFKPNFTKMEEYGRDMGADEVCLLLQNPSNHFDTPAECDLFLKSFGHQHMRMLLVRYQDPCKGPVQ